MAREIFYDVYIVRLAHTQILFVGLLLFCIHRRERKEFQDDDESHPRLKYSFFAVDYDAHS